MTTIYKADFHCDVLWKLLEDERQSFRTGGEGGKVDVTLPRLRQADTLFQTFAIYTPEHMDKTMMPILRSIDLFHRKVLADPDMTWIRTADDVRALRPGGPIGAMLSLEGADGLQGDMGMLRILFQLGVRAAGLTWNGANWGADGVMEERGGGLTGKGRTFVEECNFLGILLDVSHLSERAFWDMAEVTKRPIIASHSNVRSVCDHPRNLTDDQIKALITMDGMIGITFVPQFVKKDGDADIADILFHIERICELGGAGQLMFGSDFDGIDRHVRRLSHPGELNILKEELLKQYKEAEVRGFFAENACRFLTTYLPS